MIRLEPRLFRVYAKVRDTVAREGLFDAGARVLVAVSGGRDSLTLLDILALLAEELSLELGVFHFDHRLRPDSAGDAAFVEEVAALYGIPFFLRAEDVGALTRALGLSPEEGARHARYAGMREAASEFGADRVALGHTADDRVETFLARLLAGAGSGGLSSIPVRRDIYVRPLLGVWHEELEAWKARLPRQPRLDPTNLDVSIPRNRIRHVLLPLLEREFNPSVRAALLRGADLMEREAVLLRDLTAPLAARLIAEREGAVFLDLDAARSSRAEQRLAVREALTRAGVDATFRLVEDVITKVLEGETGSGLDLPGGGRAERGYEWVRVGARTAPAQGGASPEMTAIAGPGSYRGLGLALSVRDATGELEAGARPPDDPWRAWLDADRLSFPLSLRRPRPGDAFRPLGLAGTQKLQDFLVNAKVPREDRGGLAVLVSGEAIAWLPGYRIDDRFKVTGHTRRVMEFAAEPI